MERQIDADPRLDGRADGFAWSMRSEDGVLTIALKGELDLAAVPGLEDAIAETFTGREPLIVLDLAELAFIDSTGLRLLLGIRGAVGERAGRLLLARTPGPVLKLLDITGLVDWFEYLEGAPPGETTCARCGGWVTVEAKQCGYCNAAL